MQPHVADLGVALAKFAAQESWYLLFRHPARAAAGLLARAHCALPGVVSQKTVTRLRSLCITPQKPWRVGAGASALLSRSRFDRGRFAAFGLRRPPRMASWPLSRGVWPGH